MSGNRDRLTGRADLERHIDIHRAAHRNAHVVDQRLLESLLCGSNIVDSGRQIGHAIRARPRAGRGGVDVGSNVRDFDFRTRHGRTGGITHRSCDGSTFGLALHAHEGKKNAKHEHAPSPAQECLRSH